MNTIATRRVPLKQFIPVVAEECRKLDLYCLLSLAREDDYRPLLLKIVHTLHSSGYQSLGDVLDMNEIQLNKIKGMGDKSRQSLLDLLERASRRTDILLRSPYGISEKHKAQSN
ncbi:DNA-directed RNA polymerase subunit alpha C-terminal domain-containing protein [Paenibacillus sp. GCM10012303]|uniref:DNA-directed RNA polymerase subunit alpha C-terminal domain-containing protein n=1 Tax=Paenibacillus sp. GCM10012303 TaxID=3317340 RepID=UPI00361DD5F9